MRKEERKGLERLLRAGRASDAIRDQLAQLNKRAAGRTTYVSEGCNTASEFAGGRGESHPYLVEQDGDFIPPGFTELLQAQGLQLRAQTLPDGSKAPIRLVGSTSVRYDPSPSYFKEQFKLQPQNSELWNNFGAYEVSRGRIDEARQAYVKALEFDDNNFLAARNLGFLLWHLYGQPEEGRDLIDSAIRGFDENDRRETQSLLAEALVAEGDLSSARLLYEKSITGDVLDAPSTRWALFALEYIAGRGGEAEKVLDDILARQPNCGPAVVGKASCHWLLRGDVVSARALVADKLIRFPKDTSLLSMAHYLNLAAGELDTARLLLRRLLRLADSGPATAGNRGMGIVCDGRPLGGALACFETSLQREDVVNHLATLWAMGRDQESGQLAQSLHIGTLSLDDRVELQVVQRLLARDLATESTAAEVDDPILWEDLCGALRNPLLLSALAHHHDVDPTRRSALQAALSVVKESPKA